MKAISGEYRTGQDEGVGESQNENTDFARTAIKEIDGNAALNLGDNSCKENIVTANGSEDGLQRSASVYEGEGHLSNNVSDVIEKIPRSARNDKVDAARNNNAETIQNAVAENIEKYGVDAARSEHENNSQDGRKEDDRTAGMGISRNDGVDSVRGDKEISQTDEAVNAGEVAVYEPEEKHSYSQGIDVRAYAVYAGQMVGEMSKDSIRQSDENFYEGQKQIRHFSVPMMEAVSVLGAVSTASAIRDDLEDCALGAVKALKLIESGHIVTEELSLPREGSAGSAKVASTEGCKPDHKECRCDQ